MVHSPGMHAEEVQLNYSIYADRMQFYCPSHTYPTIPYCTIFPFLLHTFTYPKPHFACAIGSKESPATILHITNALLKY